VTRADPAGWSRFLGGKNGVIFINQRPKRACIALLVYTHGSKYRGIYPDCLSQAIDINEI
jgi:hypothetical protein